MFPVKTRMCYLSFYDASERKKNEEKKEMNKKNKISGLPAHKNKRRIQIMILLLLGTNIYELHFKSRIIPLILSKKKGSQEANCYSTRYPLRNVNI
jgi:hypothetical protein